MTADSAVESGRDTPRPDGGRRSVFQQLVGQDHVDLVLRLTLLLLLVFSSQAWSVYMFTVGFCVLAMIHLPLLRNAAFWMLLGAFQLGHVLVFELPTANNSAYVIAYWCLAVGVSLLFPDVRKALALEARLLVGLIFLFAAVWKAATPEYMEGGTFYFMLLADERFSEELLPFESVYDPLMRSHADMLERMSRLEPVITVERVPAVYWIAQAMTWWTICIEGVIAVLFLWPDGPRIMRMRNLVFLLFIVTTYPPTKLTVFAWMMTIFGLAQCPPEYKKTRFCYLAVFVGVFLTLGGAMERLIFDLFI